MSQWQPGGSFLGIAVGEYQNNNHVPLSRAVPQTQELADALESFGYRPTVLENPTLAELRTRLDEWRQGRSTLGHAPVLLAWSGHAKAVCGELRLAAHDSPAAFPPDGSYRPEWLVEKALASGADQILVLIDTCQSGQGALAAVGVALRDWAERTFPPGRAGWVGVLASCQPDEDAAGSGVLLDAAGRLLRQGPSANGYRRAWTVQNAGITGPELIQTLLGELAQGEQRPVNVESGTAQVMFRNPRWRPAERPRLVEHLVLASRGIAPHEEGWFFTGRRAVLQRIVTWMGEANPGAFVVTGSAGCGKSAVVGRIAALSDPTERAALWEHAPLEPQDPDPGVGTVDAALHLRGRGVQEVATALADVLGLPAPENHWQLVAQVTQMQSPPTVVLDGLDEAIAEQVNEIATDLLVPLSRVARVLLATRDRAFALRQPAAPEPSFVRLRGLFGPAAPVVDLDADAGTTEDIERYVARRLRFAGRGDLEERVAPVLSRRAAGDRGGFLYARIVTSQVVRQVVDVRPQGWEQRLATTISGALDHDLTAGVALVRDGVELPGAARDLLRALAWGLGRGLPGRGVWEAAATALSPEGAEYQACDLDWVLEHYGRYIVEDGADGEAVYRLYHREFVEHLVGSSPPVAGRPAAQALAEALVTLAETQTEGAREPERSSPYLRRHLGWHASLAGAPGIAALRRLAEANPDAYLPDLAASLNNLANRLAEVGQRQAALAPAHQATDTYRTLAQANPDAYLPDLAASLNNLANRLAEVGQRQAALAPAHQATDTYRTLAQANPDAYLPNLAASLNTLALRLGEVGQRQAALDIAQQATDTYRTLAQANPDAYLPNLAGSLNTLAVQLAGVGQRQAALDIAQQATDTYRTLAQANPDAYLPDLAMSLNTLAVQLAEVGQRQAALAPAQQAVDIRRTLAQANPDAYLPNLATSLNTLASHLAGVGQRQAALDIAQQATDTYRTLAQANPDAYLPNLAGSLNTLAVQLAGVGQRQAALDIAQQATDTYRTLAQANPDAYLPDLAMSLNTLAVQLAEVGQRQAALAPAHQATDTYRALAQANPDAYLPDLAGSLNNLAWHLSGGGQRQAALDIAQQATDTYRALAQANPDAYLPDLAMSLNTLAVQLAEVGQRQAALAPAQQAVDIRRTLAQANPDAYLPNLATSLNTLASHLAGVGQRQAALDIAQQATDTYRTLAQANPDAYLPDLAASLNTLASNLAELGRTPDAEAVFTACVDAFAASPGARDVLLIERAQFRLRHGDALAGLRDLTALIASSDTESTGTVMVSARRVLRAHRTVDAPAVDRVWRETTGTEPPDWLALTDEQRRLVVVWIGTPTWTESKSFLAAHADELLAGPAGIALDELALLDPPQADVHRELLSRTREHGIDAAYRPLILQDLLRAWIGTESWPDSQSFAEQHAADLLTPEAETVLAGLGDEPVVAVHLAVLGLARRDGIAATYACVTDRQLAAGRMQRALVDVDPYAIAQIAALEGHVFGEWFTAAAHLAAADAVGEAADQDESGLGAWLTELDTLAKQAEVADRQRVAAEIAELIGRSPEHAGRLSALLGMLLQPTPT